ncbi:restriction endonuclease subunit S [Streptomyces sp. TM32]|uniref:restriction endonuclease subunit S n=1 Tax=Streptomyces sp. TM32 TaxID=1652669 RepID=UPI0010125DCA|nr:restriction endonuclease subunit S [Streptomyces sp. TM32]RXS85341.1 restriction endonuclease subunit S [Streptomyces sp. TM32]
MDNVESHTGRVMNFGSAASIKSSSPIVRPGYLLYGRLRPYLNKVVLADFDGICSGEFIVFPPSGAIDSRFLLHRLLSPDFVRYVMQKNPKGDRPRAYWEQFSNFPTLLPPLSEQHRIVAKLDEQLTYIEAGERSLDAADEKKEQLLQAVLRSALRGKLASEDLSEGDAQDLVPDAVALSEGPWDIPDKWRWATIGNLFKVAVGSTPARGNSSYWGDGIPWVSSGEVSFARISSTKESITIDSIANPEGRIHPPGTVMIAMIGEGRTRGQAAILDIAAAHNQNCASIRVSETDILPEFVYYFLMARYVETRREASGGNQPALNKGKIQNLKIPIPPLGTQRNIIALVQELEEDLRGLGEAVGDGRASASKLRNALLHAAFTGVLVSQDPGDEPAPVLLDRIRALRAADDKPTRRKSVPRATSPTAPQAPGRPLSFGTQETLPL